MRHTKSLITILLLALLLASCKSRAIQTVEVPILDPQVSEPTELVPQRETLTSSDSIEYLDRGIYDCVVVITRYYTFLGNDLYDEAYQLLGSSAKRHSPNFEDFESMAKTSYKDVEIVSVEPCTVWSELHGGPPRPDNKDGKCFAVEIKTWGSEGKRSGSTVNSELQLLFLTLVRENDEWKIDAFATAFLK